MRCIQCGHLSDKVIDSRQSQDGTSIRRRRVCLACDYRFTTYEMIERGELMVKKRNGRSQPLQREKILKSFEIACDKRDILVSEIGRAVDDIILDLHQDNLRSVPSATIGLKVMEKLREIDPVAFIRYVSVYRSFDNVSDFLDEIGKFEKRAQRDFRQRQLDLKAKQDSVK